MLIKIRTNWSAVNNGIPTNSFVNAFAVSGSNIFAGTYGGGVIKSTNNGTSWTDVNNGLTNLYVISLASSGTNIFAGSGDGVFLSTNNGTNWTAVGLPNSSVMSLAVSGTNLIAVSGSGGVYLSTNNGTSWINKNEGFGIIFTVNTLLISNNYIFAGTIWQSVWRRLLSEMIGIQNISTEIPGKYSLSQNYPNPFNPTTKIKFEIPLSRVVDALGGRGVLTQLIIYDILGREVAILVNEPLQPGTYEVDFDGTRYPSGIYFYRLSSGDFKAANKMIILK